MLRMAGWPAAAEEKLGPYEIVMQALFLDANE